MSSKVTYWKLSNPQPFKGIPHLIGALQILRIDHMTRSDASIVYIEGHIAMDFGGVVSEITNLSHIVQVWRWADEHYAIETHAQAIAGVSREHDWLDLFYRYLGASKPEYAGTLVLADPPAPVPA